MYPLRWAFTVFGFPLGGLAASALFTTHESLPEAALAGLVAGAILGLAQWLALRPSVSLQWIAATSLGLALGTAAGAASIGERTDPWALALFGALTGIATGAAQAIVLGRQPASVVAPQIAIWPITLMASWAAAWPITAAVIVDESKGYATFGMSGAVIATIASGIALHLIRGPRKEQVSRDGAAQIVGAR